MSVDSFISMYIYIELHLDVITKANTENVAMQRNCVNWAKGVGKQQKESRGRELS